MKILCTICVRSGSKNLLNKNFKKLNKKFLIEYTIEQAIKSNLYSRIILSSDDKRIYNIGKKYNIDVWFLRPKRLSGDRVGKISVIKHALLKSENYYNINFDYIHDLDATSPLRNTSDIIKAHKIFVKEKANNLISGCIAKKNPYFNMVEIDKSNKISISKDKVKFIRRQDAPKVFELNASIYIWKRNILINNKNLLNDKTVFYEMPIERSIDIDSKFDWEIVEDIIKRKKNDKL